MAIATIQVIEDDVTLQDLMEAYKELQAARESLAELKEAVKSARERLARAESELERLFVKLEAQGQEES